MRLFIALPFAFAVAAAVPVSASDKTAAIYVHRTHKDKFADAKALAPITVVPMRASDDSDGLSRNHEDCNRGCIDN